ncbi:MAG TPA: Cof-type HAD-IIB family hydrolase [Candidatus Mediterraneibacter norfolkensis]|nr:Cof-type HAD-IIB family hydrolase [Candidatus Mediterraneibacter norfolkensis]
MERAVLFFDIDGTVISDDTKMVPESAIIALREAQKNGHLLFINTGRTICSVPSEVRRVRFDGYLCGCGTYLLYGDEILFARSVPQERGKKIIEEIGRCNLGGVAEGVEDVYFPGRMTRFENLEQSRRHFRGKGMGIEQPLESGGFIYDKLFIYADEKSDLERFLKYIEEDMEAIDRGGNTYEVIQKGYSKATACEFTLKKLGIPKERAYVFGDSSNDLSMFEYACHTIAMGVHSPVLDPYTEYVTSRVEEDGIANALRHYGLI